MDTTPCSLATVMSTVLVYSGIVQRPDKSVCNTDTSRAILERIVPRFLNYHKRTFKSGFIIYTTVKFIRYQEKSVMQACYNIDF